MEKETGAKNTRAVKVVAAIAVVVAIFFLVFVFTATPDARRFSEQVKGAVLTNINGVPFELKNGNIVVKEKSKPLFVDVLLNKGWVLVETGDGTYTFERDGHTIEYEENPFWFGSSVFALTA